MSAHHLVLTLDDRRYALALSSVQRVVRMCAIDSLPKAPEIVWGVINIQGRIIPVLNLRRVVRLPEREAALSDHLIIVQTTGLVTAIPADGVIGVIDCGEEDVVEPKKIFPGIEYVKGVAKREDGMVIILDIERFSLQEDEAIMGRLSTSADKVSAGGIGSRI
jgi:purine-binding chemotaxis protein CheW